MVTSVSRDELGSWNGGGESPCLSFTLFSSSTSEAQQCLVGPVELLLSCPRINLLWEKCLLLNAQTILGGKKGRVERTPGLEANATELFYLAAV